MLLPCLRALSLARALRRKSSAANREPPSSSCTRRPLSEGSCLSRSCLRLGLVRVSGLRPPRLHRRSLQLPLPNRRPAFNAAGSLPSDFPPAILNAVPPAQLDSPARFVRQFAPFGACRRFCRLCVSIRAAYPLSASFGFRPSGKPLLRSPLSTGRFHAAQGRQCRSPSELCIAPPCRDAYPISFESSFQRLAHTGQISALDRKLHLPARAGNVCFQFVTGLPTDGTMRLLNL